ncbi:hypothetical protein L1887_31908 [Cichorium endivia]|nr:hypothetical protein L1887_31908 [Cichorium endivia]
MGSILKSLSVVKNPIRSFIGFVEANISLLKHCSKQRLITEGQVLHGRLYKMGISSHRHVAVKLLIMYLDFRKSTEVDQLLKDYNGFDMIVQNCLISANVDWGNIDEARKLFDEMPERNEVSWTALISGYLKYRRVDESMWLFQRNPFQNVISWTAAISGLLSNEMHSKSINLFSEMLKSGVKPNNVTFVSIIRASTETTNFTLGMSILSLAVKLGYDNDVSVCNSLITFSLRLRKLELARKIFETMGKRDVISWTAILDMYIEMGNLDEARKVFDEMPERNEVSWSAMISRYTQKGYTKEAIKLFHQMFKNGITPNSSCLSSAINALANLKELHSGQNIHAHVTKIGLTNDVFVNSSLIDLYDISCKMNCTTSNLNMKSLFVNDGTHRFISSEVGKRGNPKGTVKLCYSRNAPRLQTRSCLVNGNGIGEKDGVIIVDHGSRRKESNLMLNEFVAMFVEKTGYPIVEPAHMELAKPSIQDAFNSCVEKGANRVIVTPFFLFPGRHWHQDIPSLTAEAAKDYPGVSYMITAPLGLHSLLVDVVDDRIKHCVSHVAGHADECAVCVGTGKCRLY